VVALAFSADGTRLMSASEDGTAALWDVGPWPPPGRFPDDAPPPVTQAGGVRVDGDGRLVAGDRLLDGLDPPIREVVLSPDGLTVAAASPAGVRLWDPSSGRGRTLPRSAPPERIAFTAEGVVVRLVDGRVFLYPDDLPHGEALRSEVARRSSGSGDPAPAS